VAGDPSCISCVLEQGSEAHDLLYFYYIKSLTSLSPAKAVPQRRRRSSGSGSGVGRGVKLIARQVQVNQANCMTSGIRK
jgi:hypothetical protein